MSNNTYTPEMVHAAVERGAAWLDEHCPDWTNHIDLDELDLAEQSVCVLGQTAECLIGRDVWLNPYTLVLDHFDKNDRWAEAHGFDIRMNENRYLLRHTYTEYEAEVVARYEMLTVGWRTYIRQRLQVPA